MQATGVKSEESAGQAAKRQKLETSAEVAKGGNAKCANAIISNLSLQPEPVVEDTLRVDTTACQRPEPNPVASPKDPLSLKQTLHPVAALGFPFHINRYKLDNRPKSFTINAPLPAGLASVSTSSPTPQEEKTLMMLLFIYITGRAHGSRITCVSFVSCHES